MNHAHMEHVKIALRVPHEDGDEPCQEPYWKTLEGGVPHTCGDEPYGKRFTQAALESSLHPWG